MAASKKARTTSEETLAPETQDTGTQNTETQAETTPQAQEPLYFIINDCPVEVKIGVQETLNIETNAESWECEEKTSEFMSFDKASKQLTAHNDGTAQFVFTYRRGDETRKYTLNINAVTENTTSFRKPGRLFLGNRIESIDIGKSVTLRKATTTYDTNSVIAVVSNNQNAIRIIKNDDGTWTLTAVGMGSSEIRYTAYQYVMHEQTQQKIDNTEYVEEFVIQVVAFEKAELEVEPQLSMITLGNRQKLTIRSGYDTIEYTSSRPDVASIENGVLNAKKLGSTIIGVRGHSEDKLDSFISWEMVVAYSMPTDQEPDKDTYGYDDVLPTTLKDGAIVYKTGKFENSPVIEYRFDGTTKKYSCIGIKLQQYGEDGEPHSLAFLSEEGTIDDVMYKYKDKIIELGIEETLYEKIKETIRQDMKDYLANNNFQVGETGIKEVKTPKWVGTLYNDSAGVGRRLNTCGLEETWGDIRGNGNSEGERPEDWRPLMNNNSNTDPITLLFNTVEPYKSFKRMAILHSDFNTGKYAGLKKKIYYENADTLAMHEDGMRLAELFARGVNSTPEITNYDFFNLIKKSYYIDVEIRLLNQVYYLKAIGGEPFVVDIADYIPGLDRENPGMQVHYYMLAESKKADNWKVGLFPYKVEGSKIHANLHPAFYDWYDNGGELRSEETINSFITDGRTYPDRKTQLNDIDSITMDYRYFGSFFQQNRNDTYMRSIYRNKSSNQSYIQNQEFFARCYRNGNLPNQGVNFVPLNFRLYHLTYQMYMIEYGHTYRSKNNTNTKWYVHSVSELRDSFSLPLGSTTAVVNNVHTYRGVDYLFNLYCFYQGARNGGSILEPPCNNNFKVEYSNYVKSGRNNQIGANWNNTDINQRYRSYEYKLVPGTLFAIEANSGCSAPKTAKYTPNYEVMYFGFTEVHDNIRPLVGLDSDVPSAAGGGCGAFVCI